MRPETLTGVNSIITEGLLPLTRIDAVVARAFFRMMNLLSSPNAVMNDVGADGARARVLADARISGRRSRRWGRRAKR